MRLKGLNSFAESTREKDDLTSEDVFGLQCRLPQFPVIRVLTEVTIGGGVMGIAGMLLGVPLAAALYRLLRDNLNKEFCTNRETAEGDFARTESDIKQKA